MSVLIDGYNLLHATGILGQGIGPGGLERARLALLNFLAESLDPKEIPRTTVVFDAAETPPGLAREMVYRGLTVRFASQYPDADSLIEELIRVESSPKWLIVVSSDRRIQRAARRRRAKAVASEDWYDKVCRRRATRAQQRGSADDPRRSSTPLLEEDVAYWINQFGGEAALEQWIREETSTPPTLQEEAPPSKESLEKPSEFLENPFPEGYGEDLLRGTEFENPDGPNPSTN